MIQFIIVCIRKGLKAKEESWGSGQGVEREEKQKKLSFSNTDPYGMQDGCPALLAGTHSFCLV